jgi:hypothetical protein
VSGLSTYTGPELFKYASVLAGRLKAVPAWSDFANAVEEVLDHNVDTPRRDLSQIRDSSSYRKDEIISGYYTGGNVTDINTGANIPIAVGTYLPSAQIVEIVCDENSDGLPVNDTMTVQFALAGDRTVQWTFNIAAPQERSLLVQGANMLGFDFFNTDFTDKDYQRLYEFIAKYWPVSGTQSFVDFIGFINNIKIQCDALWTFTDPTTPYYPVLEPLPPKSVKVTDGGNWWLTSHVELTYNALQTAILDGETTIDETTLQSLYNLFYYFAPINLVLERIVAAVSLETTFFTSFAAQELEIDMCKFTYSEHLNGNTKPLLAPTGQFLQICGDYFLYESPILDMHGGLTFAQPSYSAIEFSKFDYDYSDVYFTSGLAFVVASTTIWSNSCLYEIPVLSAQNTMGTINNLAIIEFSKITYNAEDLFVELTLMMVGSRSEIKFSKFLYETPTPNMLVNLSTANQILQVESAIVISGTSNLGVNNNILLNSKETQEIGLGDSMTYPDLNKNFSFPILNRTAFMGCSSGALLNIFSGSICYNNNNNNIFTDNYGYYHRCAGFNSSIFQAKVTGTLGVST